MATLPAAKNALVADNSIPTIGNADGDPCTPAKDRAGIVDADRRCRGDGEIDVNEVRDEDGAGEEEEEEDTETVKEEAVVVATKVTSDLSEASKFSNIAFLARGAYNYVWLVSYITAAHVDGHDEGDFQEKKFVLRMSRKDSPLQPYRLRHEVACLEFLEANVPSIPAPRVYAWNDGVSPESSPAFIAEEYIKGQALNVIWPQLLEDQKAAVTHEIANVLADLGETRFDAIGGLALNAPAGPTIEAAKVFNGRARFHSPQCYNIGPYSSSKEYILACYDREIYYYTNAASSDIVEDAFTETSVTAFIAQLQAERSTLATEESAVFAQIDAEPRVLTHEDFHSGNMLVRDGHLVGVVDWEFSGTYPLSELLGSIAILQISGPVERNEELEEEEDRWHLRYLKEVEEVVRARGWSHKEVATLMGGGHRVLQNARSIMFPEQPVDDKEEEA